MTKENIKAFSQRVTTSNRTELIVVLFDMELQNIDDAEVFLKAGDVDSFHESLKQAKRVNDLLNTSLDMNYAISAELASTYRFVGNTLNEASLKKEDANLKVVRNVLLKLREAFAKVAMQDDSKPLMGNTEKVYAGLTYSNGKLDEIAYDLNGGAKRGFTV